MARAASMLRPAGWSRQSDFVLLITRLLLGGFLIWGVWDNIGSAARMAEFAAFLRGHGFPWPEWMARLSVWAQFAVGCSFVIGLFVRWAGVVCAINFLVAVVMVDAAGGIRSAFPATCLILFGLIFATQGGGRFALDRIFAIR